MHHSNIKGNVMCYICIIPSSLSNALRFTFPAAVISAQRLFPQQLPWSALVVLRRLFTEHSVLKIAASGKNNLCGEVSEDSVLYAVCKTPYGRSVIDKHG